MPQNGYSIGNDVTLDIVAPAGLIRVTITNFTSKQDTTDQRVKPLNGENDNLVFYEGWSGSFDVERKDASLDNYFARAEDDYFAGLEPGQVSITETITEPGGGVSQFRYTRVTLKFDDAGAKQKEKSIPQKVGFMAARRLRV